MLRSLVVLLATVVLAACTVDLLGPDRGFEGLPDGLEVSFSVEPDVVSPHAPFSAQLRVKNTTDRTVEVVTVHGCLATPTVLRNGERVPFEGSGWGCTDAVTTHSFDPGEVRSRTWDMRAELYAQDEGDVDGAPASKGTYAVRAEFHTQSAGGSGRRPTVERTLRVR